MIRRSLTILLAVVVAGGVLGCGEKAGEHAEAAKENTQAAMGQAQQVSAKLSAHLARADAADGHKDMVVSNCSGCKLQMAGSPDYVLEVGDYSMQFCTADCKQQFADGGEAAILALEIPDAPGHEGHGH